MSQALFIAVAQSNIKKLRAAIQELNKNNIDINNEIFSGKTILDIAIETAGDNLENSSSKKIIGILKEEGAITFLENSSLPDNEEPKIWGNNFSLANFPVNSLALPVTLPPPSPKAAEVPPNLPRHPVSSRKGIIRNGIASLPRKGGRKIQTRRKRKTSTKSKKSRKLLLR
jgi:hypothetical protein